MVQATKKMIGKDGRSAVVSSLKKQFEEVEGGVLTDFRGLDVSTISDLRRKFREQGVSFKVVKNTLTRIAVADTQYKDLQEQLVGPTGIAFAGEDLIAPARVAVEFAKDFEALKIKGGFLEGEVLQEAEIRELAKLAGKNELLSQLLSVFNSSGQKFLGVLNGVPQKFLGVLQAKADQMEES